MSRTALAVALALSSCAPRHAAEARLLFGDDFSDLRAWSVEGTGAASAAEGSLVWDCSGTREGTAWCRTRFEGPTRVTYDVQVLDGRNNINFFAYARLERDGHDALLPSGAGRTGAYGEYHRFPNYLVTYLVEGGLWRVRFRKNPGFALLSEARVDGPEPARWRAVAYEFARDGTVSLHVDGHLVHRHRDAEPLPLSGYHGLRTWRTHLRYRNFRVYRLFD